MPRPGVNIINRDAPPSAGTPIKTGTAFFVGTADKGPHAVAQKVTSLVDFVAKYGDRQSYSVLYDSLDAYFREGGGEAYIARLVGPAPVQAAFTFNTGANASFTVKAKYVGSYGNALTVQILHPTGTTFSVRVRDGAGTIIEETPAYDDKTAAVADNVNRSTVQFVDADPTKGDPDVAAATSLVGGTDDRAAVTTTQVTNALNLFTKGLGPGQVLVPGDSAGATANAVIAHVTATGRVALLDAPDTSVVATITAAATAASSQAGSENASMWAGYAIVPGIIAGTTRRVPYSAVQAGLESRRDRATSQNVPAAGRDFPLRYVVSLAQAFSDADRETLLLAGVNAAKDVGGVLETYGYRSLASPTGSKSDWVQFNYTRLRMAITFAGEQIGESFVFDQVDGNGLKASEFGSALAGELLRFFVAGSLYGSSPEEAFFVDVGPSVNTPESVAAGELHAVCQVRMSPHAELVVIEFVKTPITQGVAQA